MTDGTKDCNYCGRLNDIDNIKCIHCGRLFVIDTKMAKKKSATLSGGKFRLPENKAPIIVAVILFISLFLPWFSVFIIKLSAFEVAKIFSIASNFTGRTDPFVSLINILIYLIPIGCVAVVVLSFLEREIKLVGSITGYSPLVIFLLLLVKSPEIIRMLGIGIIVALITGVVLIIVTRRE